MKPTDRPWRVLGNGGAPAVVNDDSDIIAMTDTYWLSRETQEANAALICRCVNSHDQLVEALTCFQMAYNEWNKRHDGGEDDLHYAAKMASAALKLAGEE